MNEYLLMFAESLKRLREEIHPNLSLRQFSTLCKVDYTYLSRIENGKRVPSPAVFKRICRALRLKRPDRTLWVDCIIAYERDKMRDRYL